MLNYLETAYIIWSVLLSEKINSLSQKNKKKKKKKKKKMIEGFQFQIVVTLLYWVV